MDTAEESDLQIQEQQITIGNDEMADNEEVINVEDLEEAQQDAAADDDGAADQMIEMIEILRPSDSFHNGVETEEDLDYQDQEASDFVDVDSATNYIEDNLISGQRLFPSKAAILKCDRCKFRTSSRANMDRHKRKHTGIKPYKCNQCNYTTAYTSDLFKHLRSKHKYKIPKYNRGPKSFNLSQFTNSKGHSSNPPAAFPPSQTMVVATGQEAAGSSQRGPAPAKGKAYRCNQCPFTSKYSKSLRRHRLSHVAATAPDGSAAATTTAAAPVWPPSDYQCDYCSFGSNYVANLRRHEKLAHPGKKTYPCSLCPYTAIINGSLKTHMEEKHYGEHPFVCLICGQGFITLDSMYRHKETKHRRQNPQQRRPPGGSTARQPGGGESSKDPQPGGSATWEEGGEPRQATLYPPPPGGEASGGGGSRGAAGPALSVGGGKARSKNRLYYCPYYPSCDFTTKYDGNVGKHVLSIHQKLRRYKCPQCSFMATFKHSLMTHMRKHTGEMPFKCVCGKLFKHSTSLKTHQIGCQSARTSAAQGGGQTAPRSGGDRQLQAREEEEVEEEEYEDIGPEEQEGYQDDDAEQPMDLTLEEEDAGEMGREGVKDREKLMQLAASVGYRDFYRCSKCDFSCKYRCYFIRHQRKHSNDKPFKCEVADCQYATKYPGDMGKHLKVKHGLAQADCQAKLIHCEVSNCGFKTNYRYSLDIHMVNAHGGQGNKFKCSKCEYMADQRSDVIKHKYVEHNIEEPRFGLKNMVANMKSRMAVGSGVGGSKTTKPARRFTGSAHDYRKSRYGKKRLRCHLCGFACTHQGNLTSHLKTHAADLTSKLTSDWTSSRPVDLSSTNQSPFSTSGRGHTGVATRDPAAESGHNSEIGGLVRVDTSLQCPHCLVVFDDLIMHTLHMGWHAGPKKPFQCSVCGHICSDKYEFTCHFTRAHFTH